MFIMLQFQGPEIEYSISVIYGTKNCRNPTIFGPKNSIYAAIDFWADNSRNAAFSGPRNCDYAREILYEAEPYSVVSYFLLRSNISISFQSSVIQAQAPGQANGQ